MHDESTLIIPLSRGKVTIIDAADADLIAGRAWHAMPTGGHWYAQDSNKNHPALMHRLIMGTPKGMVTDHIDGDGLNNRRLNLRIATHSQNNANTGLSRVNTSGYIGVTWFKRDRVWMARIRIQQKQTYIGLFRTAEDAARARDAAAREEFGEFAVLNFPDGQ